MALKTPPEMIKELKILNRNIQKAEKVMNDFIIAWDQCMETLDELNKE